MPTSDVYLLALHEPYTAEPHPVPIDATIIHARTLLHPAVPQPDGGRMYRCLTEFPDRTEHCLVPLSTLTFELDGGALWPEIADWERVIEAVVRISRAGACDSMPLGLPAEHSFLLGQGPGVPFTILYPDGTQRVCDPGERQQYVDEYTAHVHRWLREGPFRPGLNLVDPPRDPAVMPYRPFRPRQA
jgi:hypothetical protein